MPPKSINHPGPDDSATFWRLPAVLAYTQRSRSSIYRDASFPKPVKLGPNTAAWVAAEVKDWCQERISQSREESHGSY
jgi:prophage regulatory protein